jgi:hypothetical protein
MTPPTETGLSSSGSYGSIIEGKGKRTFRLEPARPCGVDPTAAFASPYSGHPRLSRAQIRDPHLMPHPFIPVSRPISA